MRVVSEFVAPWALPNEEIPVHLTWESTDTLSGIKLSVPEEFRVREIFNVKRDNIDNEERYIPASELSTQSYFGFLVTCTKIYDDFLVEKEMVVSFLFDNGQIERRVLRTKIVRPLIKLHKKPEKVEINDSSNLKKLFNFGVTHSGLGRAQVNLVVSRKGVAVSHMDSLYFKILEELIKENAFIQSKYDIVIDEKDVEIDSQWLHDESERMVEKLQQGEFPLERELEERVLEILKDESLKSRLTGAIYSRMRRILISRILYYLDKYPNEDIELAYGNVKTMIEPDIKELHFIFKYVDSIGNEYPDVEALIEVNDIRKDKSKIFEAPVNVEWKSEVLEFS